MEGQRRPTAPNDDQRRLTQANAGPRKPTAPNDGTRRPTKANAGPQRPTTTNAGQRRPTQAHSAQRRPTQVNAGPHPASPAASTTTDQHHQPQQQRHHNQQHHNQEQQQHPLPDDDSVRRTGFSYQIPSFSHPYACTVNRTCFKFYIFFLWRGHSLPHLFYPTRRYLIIIALPIFSLRSPYGVLVAGSFIFFRIY